MAVIPRYSQLDKAIKDGWDILDRTDTGYLLRKWMGSGFVLGRCDVRPLVCVPDEEC